MKKLGKVMRLCGLVMFLILAGVGISITGISPTRRIINRETTIEMVEEDKEEEQPEAEDAVF